MMKNFTQRREQDCAHQQPRKTSSGCQQGAESLTTSPSSTCALRARSGILLLCARTAQEYQVAAQLVVVANLHASCLHVPAQKERAVSAWCMSGDCSKLLVKRCEKDARIGVHTALCSPQHSLQ